jgi:MFS family permease
MRHNLLMAPEGGQAGSMPATWRSLFAVGEFRALWVAQTISLLGDQLARVAVAWLVFDRTRSALLTAVVYALTFLPWVLGGPLLGGLADRFPRRTVMVVCSLLSTVLVGLLAVPGMPTVALCGLLFVIVLLESPFLAARSALLIDVLPDDRYVLASALGNMTGQAVQVLGFAAGGLVVAVIGPRTALLLDAATFLVAALVVRVWSARRPAPKDPTEDGVGPWLGRLRGGARAVFADRRLRALVLLAWLATFSVVPEGLAVPYAASLGGGPGTVGLLLAAEPLGATMGALLLSRLVPPAGRLRLLVPLAALSSAPLIGYALSPPLPVILGLLIASGLGGSYQLIANTSFMQLAPAHIRGQAFGLAAAGLVAGQGLGLAAAGAAAELVAPASVVAGAGLVGLLLVIPFISVSRSLSVTTAPSP